MVTEDCPDRDNIQRDAEDGILCTSQRYDFVGNVIARHESYTDANGMIDDRIERSYTYDDRGRLLRETAQVNGGEPAVVDYEYDELGRLSGRMLGTVEEQSEYDIRNWQTAKNTDLFDMKLAYSHTGNITAWQWQHKDSATGDDPQNRYEFLYDKLSRLINTNQYVDGERVRQNVERHTDYDRNGNLLSMIRYENGEEQCNMKYQYQGNRLYRYMEDALVDVDLGADTVTMRPSALRFGNLKPWQALHEYDANGNVTKDWERGMNMSYNCLNLLEYASDNNANAINYHYLADGTKLAATNGDECGFSYRGSFTYRTDESSQPNRVFESAPFGGGRIVRTADDETEVRYFVTDHLGSVRVVVNSWNEVLERNDYQPFGKRWATSSMPVSDNRDRFNGKEDQIFAGFSFSDYGARMYDYQRGRWLMQDPEAENFIGSSPYCFCGNNPISRVDVNGAEWYSYQEEYEDEDGAIRTRTQYKFVKGVMSEREMQEGGYAYLGRTYETNDTYFSLGGARIAYDKSDYWEMAGIQNIKDADLTVAGAIDAINMAGDFWQKYNELISTGSGVGTVAGNFMELSKGFQGMVNTVGVFSTISSAFNDYHLLKNGKLHGVALADAAANIVSVMGWQGATLSVGYTTSKAGARGMGKLEQALQVKADQLYKRYVGMYGGYGF